MVVDALVLLVVSEPELGNGLETGFVFSGVLLVVLGAVPLSGLLGSAILCIAKGSVCWNGCF